MSNLQNPHSGNVPRQKRGLPKEFFLKKKKDIKELFDKGKRHRFAEYSLVVRKTGEATTTQANVVVAKKYGNAPQRNRAKRRFRDIIIRLRDGLQPGYLFILIPHNKSDNKLFSFLLGDVEKSLKKEGIFQSLKQLKS